MRRHLGPLLLVAGLVLAACSAGAGPTPDGRPNVVFVLTDDLATNLLPFLPHVQALQKAGTSFANYTVTDSLCCPSRSSIFSGRYPHDTGVFSNTGADGGYAVFHGRGEEANTVATDLQKAGYRTAMMGKYLNGYQPTDPAPPGWSEWDVAGNGYAEYDYDLNENGAVTHHASAPQDYLTDVLAGRAEAFVTASAAAHTPFFLEVATFAPHAPSTPAPSDVSAFPGLTAPRGPAFDTLPSDAPPWLAAHAALNPRQVTRIDAAFRKRAQAVQAVDRLLAGVQSTLTTAGVAADTVVVFSSDNGYHMGEYRLTPGKMTAFDTDVRVPLVMAGPGIAAGATATGVARNVDLRPTVDALAGVATPPTVDGLGLDPLLHGGPTPSGWPTAALVEHHGPDRAPDDPDLPEKGSGNPPTYAAVRTAASTYVEYADGRREYYDLVADPDELHNTAAQLPSDRAAQLHTTLTALQGCHGRAACTAAAGGAP